MTLLFGKEENEQVAFVVSKKVSPSSVVRHQVKRRFAAAVERFLPRVSRTAKMVFFPKAGAGEATTEAVAAEMEALLKRIRLLS